MSVRIGVASLRIGVMLAAALGALSPATSARAEGAPLCRVSVSLEPERALVGQQVLYELRILRREDVRSVAWEQSLAFPGFRAEWLPGVTEDRAVEVSGASYLAFQERRALFPARDGVLEIPSAGLRCGTPSAEEVAVIPRLRLPVEPLPEAGRPAGFSGLVGPVRMSVTLIPEAVHLGESVRLPVLVKGAANVWDAPQPLPPDARIEGADLFASPPELQREAGRRLDVQHSYVYDLVPRREGPVRIPELRIDYFDPRTREFASAVAPAREVTVSPRPAAAADATPDATPPAAGRTGSSAVRWRGLAVVGAMVAALGATPWLLRRLRALGAGPWRRVDATLDEARSRADAEARGASLAEALRLGLATRLPGAHALSSEELLERAGDDAAARAAALLLARLDRARFGTEGVRDEAPGLDEVRDALAALRRGEAPAC